MCVVSHPRYSHAPRSSTLTPAAHMLDLSEEPDDENIAICVEYFKRMAPMKIWLEMEIGITGGEEDGVSNENVDPEKLYTSPEQVFAVYEALSKIGDNFSIAAAFGNVHGVYKPGNVKLSPERLGKHQEYAKKMLGSSLDKPIYLVMHGGSGSTDNEIQTAVKHGVVKMNIDTGTYTITYIRACTCIHTTYNTRFACNVIESNRL